MMTHKGLAREIKRLKKKTHHIQNKINILSINKIHIEHKIEQLEKKY